MERGGDGLKGFIAVVILIAAVGFGGNGDVKDAVDHGSVYCEMVGLYKKSSGRMGWPEYDENIKCGK